MLQIISRPPTPDRPACAGSGRPLRALALVGLALLLCCPRAFAAQAGWSNAYPTRYATIYYAGDKDLSQFTRNIGSGMSFLGESQDKNPMLAKNRVDRIVDVVMRLLDMNPPNFHFTVYVYQKRADVESAYRRLGMMGPVPPAFYAHQTESITVSVEEITDGMLAHEIAHAVICHHFPSPPPMKMQEILAQYVDKHLGEE